MKIKARKCIICGRRPENGNGNGYCHNCWQKIQSLKTHSSNSVTARHPLTPRFIVYHGNVVELKLNGNGRYKPSLTGRNPEKLPKKGTLNIDRYVQGYTREQVKKMQRVVLQLTSVYA